MQVCTSNSGETSGTNTVNTETVNDATNTNSGNCHQMYHCILFLASTFDGNYFHPAYLEDGGTVFNFWQVGRVL